VYSHLRFPTFLTSCLAVLATLNQFRFFLKDNCLSGYNDWLRSDTLGRSGLFRVTGTLLGQLRRKSPGPKRLISLSIWIQVLQTWEFAVFVRLSIWIQVHNSIFLKHKCFLGVFLDAVAYQTLGSRPNSNPKTIHQHGSRLKSGDSQRFPSPYRAPAKRI